MKKIVKFLGIFLLIFTCFIGSGCGEENIHVNEIHNRAYSIDIDVVELQNSIRGVIEKCKPAVLGVTAYDKTIFQLNYTKKSVGSGVVYSAKAKMKDGTIVDNIRDTINSNDVETYQYYLVTNRHVVEDAKLLKIYDGDEDVEINCELKAYDDKVDLAVIYFEYAKYIEPLQFADSDELYAGDFVIAIGHPYGYEYYGSSSFGIVSNAKRYISDDTDDDGTYDWDAEYIQHDAAINSGNSGGPLLNIEGKIVGINTLKIDDSKADNMGFAIPSNVVVDDIEVLAKGSKPARPTLGVIGTEVKNLTEEGRSEYNVPSDLQYGFVVTEVIEGVCKDAGVMVGDIIVMFNGVDIKYSYQINLELHKFSVNSGDTTTLKVIRNGESIFITITF